MPSHLSYAATLEYLYERLPMFSRIGKAALKPDLTNTLKLCDALGNPQHRFQSVHIAGTNGKGSTSHMLAAVFAANGYKTGLYTSPHLVDFRERIRVNGEMVPEDWVVNFVANIRSVIEEVNPSFFEITVAMAFQYFAEMEVDMAIIETGLGGRLDSTNVIVPRLSIITNISYDHKDLLGDTLTAIAGEKAGIIKEGVPVVIGEQHDETERVFFEHSVHKHSPLYYAEALWDLVKTGTNAAEGYQHYKAVNKAERTLVDITTDLTGTYQQHNIKTVLASVEILKGMGYQLPEHKVVTALTQVKQLTGLRGRWDVLQRQPLIVADVAHNEGGLTEVVAQWNTVVAERKYVLLGFVRDKDITKVLQLLPRGDVHYCFCNAAIPRALPAAELGLLAAEAGIEGTVYGSVGDALTYLTATMANNDALLIVGSFFIVGEAMEYLNKGDL